MKDFTQPFLDSIKEHQLTILENSENVKCFKMATPHTIAMSFTVIYVDDKVIITSDMAHYVFGYLSNPYNFFLGESALNASYLVEKVIAQDTVFPVQNYDSGVAKQEIRRTIHEYADFDLAQELYESLGNVDFESEHEVEHWLYSLEGEAIIILSFWLSVGLKSAVKDLNIYASLGLQFLACSMVSLSSLRLA